MSTVAPRLPREFRTYSRDRLGRFDWIEDEPQDDRICLTFTMAEMGILTGLAMDWHCTLSEVVRAVVRAGKRRYTVYVPTIGRRTPASDTLIRCTVRISIPLYAWLKVCRKVSGSSYGCIIAALALEA